MMPTNTPMSDERAISHLWFHASHMPRHTSDLASRRSVSSRARAMVVSPTTRAMASGRANRPTTTGTSPKPSHR